MAKYLDAEGLQHYFRSLKPKLVRECTQAEYDLLTEEQKKGLFVITDAQSGSGGTEGDTGAGNCGERIMLMYDGKAILDNGGGSQPVMVLIRLLPSGWDSSKQQGIAVQGILEDESKQLIIPTPAITSQEAYYQANIRVVAQGNDSLVFQAETVPTAPIYVYISIMNVRVPDLNLSEYKWWSPKMTGNHTPSPYVASADYEYTSLSGGGTYYAFYAFDGKTSGDTLSGGWYSSHPDAWIQLDFGSAVSIAGIRMLPKDYTNWPGLFPKSLNVQGSDDGVNWVTLIEDVGDEYDPYLKEWRTVLFAREEKYRFFRINCLSNYGQYRQSIIDEIEFFKKEDASDGSL